MKIRGCTNSNDMQQNMIPKAGSQSDLRNYLQWSLLQMIPACQHGGIRSKVVASLEAKGIKATPQALNAIACSVTNVPEEVAGDSDSLLLGLLLSGSYTVDALELAGVNPRRLRKLTQDSFYPMPSYGREGLEVFFDVCSASQALIEHALSKRTLETADILRFAVAPIGVTDRETLNRSSESLSDALRTLIFERLMEFFIERFCCAELFPEQKFQERKHALSLREIHKIRQYFNRILGESGIRLGEYVIRALNQWFCDRQILTQPADLVNNLIEFFNYSLDFGANLFTQNGGNYETLEKSLTLSQRINPERDASGIILCCHDDRIFAAEYTYRNSLIVETSDSLKKPWQRLSIQAVRPVPLVSQQSLDAFQHLVSSQDVNEGQIQSFLDNHPELLSSFGGYSGVHPHVLLREEGKGDMIPDYLLELPVGHSFDIVDLKLPNARLSVGNRYKRISYELQKAVSQLRAYQNFFEKSRNRKWFTKEYGLEPFRPQIVVVMGRNSEFQSPEERKEIEQQLNSTKLITYDELIGYARSRSISLSPPTALG